MTAFTATEGSQIPAKRTNTVPITWLQIAYSRQPQTYPDATISITIASFATSVATIRT
jgi:hypothetical protein